VRLCQQARATRQSRRHSSTRSRRSTCSYVLRRGHVSPGVLHLLTACQRSGRTLTRGVPRCRDKTVGLAPALWIRSQMFVRRLRKRDWKHAPSPSAWVGTPNDEALPLLPTLAGGRRRPTSGQCDPLSDRSGRTADSVESGAYPGVKLRRCRRTGQHVLDAAAEDMQISGTDLGRQRVGQGFGSPLRDAETRANALVFVALPGERRRSRGRLSAICHQSLMARRDA
jgi:hypothetical protein